MVKFYIIIGHLLTGPHRGYAPGPHSGTSVPHLQYRTPEPSNTPKPLVGVTHSVTTATQRIIYNLRKNRSNAIEYVTSRSIFRIPHFRQGKRRKTTVAPLVFLIPYAVRNTKNEIRTVFRFSFFFVHAE